MIPSRFYELTIHTSDGGILISLAAICKCVQLALFRCIAPIYLQPQLPITLVADDTCTLFKLLPTTSPPLAVLLQLR